MSAASLPEPLLRPTVLVHNGYLSVIGGVRPDGTTIPMVYTSRINPDGTLDAWQAQTGPAAVSAATAFTFGGNVYVLGGQTAATTDPNSQAAVGTKDTWRTSILNGQVGLWIADKKLSKDRTMHAAWQAFGQILAAGGVHGGSPGGGSELERSVILPDGSMSSWNSIVSSNTLIGANVYNAAACVSPVRPAGAGPRFLLLGGHVFATTPPGTLTSTVYFNTAP